MQQTLAPEVPSNKAVPRLSRSPHPYTRRGTNETFTLSTNGARLSQLDSQQTGDHAVGSPTEYEIQDKRKASDISNSETEDEGLHQHKALPPTPLDMRKGLRIPSRLNGTDATPLLTPSALYEEEERLNKGYFEHAEHDSMTQDTMVKARAKFHARRRAELVRRACEVLLLIGIAGVVLNGRGVWEHALAWSNSIKLIFAITTILVVEYPVRLLLGSFRAGGALNVRALQIPSVFDPAPLLYPPTIPIMVAFSTGSPAAVLLNIVLGFSSLPAQLIPIPAFQDGLNHLHYALVLVVLDSVMADSIHVSGASTITKLGLTPETLSLLFPLHQYLVLILGTLTTTSLLSSELQLLSVGLINLLVLSQSPQSQILSILLWTGGLSLMVFCYHVATWNVTLERMPLSDVKKLSRALGTGSMSFLSTLTRTLNYQEDDDQNSYDGEDNETASYTDCNPDSAVSITSPGASGLRKRRPSLHQQKNRVRAGSGAAIRQQIEVKKWAYAIWTYMVTILAILGPIRSLVTTALGGHEPFGWALGYLFGGLPPFHDLVHQYTLQETQDSLTTSVNNWIPLPPLDLTSTSPLTLLTTITTITTTHPSNLRLLLFAYWSLILTLGITTVVLLTPHLYVDTRRKIFHFTMVFLLLPTIPLDPCFVSLALSLVLAVFLLLDFYRAAQLRPVSQPLARFLAPYIDGRDLRGPVIVSHIFLLIGCATPLWLSLAGVGRAEGEEVFWRGWEVKGEERDVSMLSGVICVGMGDAAASLIGRRYGRRKWPWAGGKSLEGSVAFAAAVVLGLGVGKAWLQVGGWGGEKLDGVGQWAGWVARSAVAAGGASFTEAVLTGCNDNVVVPVVLWLLVRGLRL